MGVRPTPRPSRRFTISDVSGTPVRRRVFRLDGNDDVAATRRNLVPDFYPTEVASDHFGQARLRSVERAWLDWAQASELLP